MRTLATLLLSLALAAAAAAQSTTANLVGRASSDGQPVPGATVTIVSPALQGTRSFVTAADGTYSFPALPPGSYTVTFEMAAMQTVVKRAELPLSETVRVDAELRPILTETLTVSPVPQSVLETPQLSVNFDARTIEYLPIGRGILDAVRLAPGVSPTGPLNNVMINGGYSYDNLFLVNGVTITEQSRGQPHNLFIEDAIQELTVMTAAVSAEYGRFTGGVVNVLTRSGGNELSGSARDTLSSDRWTARTPYPAEPEHLHKINNDYQATVGGRILRDRLWFFLAGRYAERSQAEATIGTNIPYTTARHEARYEGKLTASLAARHTLVGSYLNINLGDVNTAVDPAELGVLENRYTPNSLQAVHYTGILSPRFVAEGQYHRKYFEFKASNPVERDRIGGTPIVDNATNAIAGSPLFCWPCGRTERSNHEALLKGSWFGAWPRLGNHSIVFGYDDYHETGRENLHQTPSDYTVFGELLFVGGRPYLHAVPGETEIELDLPPTPTQAGDFGTRALFLNDRIDFGAHLSANLGVRYDRSRGVDELGRLQAKDALVSPRLGVIFDVLGNGSDRISASYSRYTSRMQERVGQAASGLFGVSSIWLYNGPEINGDPAALVPNDVALRRLFAWFDASGGVNNEDDLELRQAFGEADIPRVLETPSMDEIALGYGHQFGGRAFARIDFVKREWGRFYTNIVSRETGKKIDSAGAVRDRVLLETSDEALVRRYDGIVLQGGASWRRITFGGNYTWSRLRGNVEQETAGSGLVAIQVPGRYYPEYTSFAQFSPVGYLSGDVRHRANAWIGYEIPTPVGRFDLSLLQQYHSARNYNAAGVVDLRRIVANPGYLTPPTVVRYYYAPRGSLRLDAVSSTGVGINYARRLGAYELFAEADVRNVFNQQAVEDPAGVSQLVRASNTDRNLAIFDPRSATPIECPRGVSSASAQCKGIANYQLATNFGQPVSKTAYQEPRTYGLSLGFRF